MALHPSHKPEPKLKPKPTPKPTPKPKPKPTPKPKPIPIPNPNLNPNPSPNPNPDPNPNLTRRPLLRGGLPPHRHRDQPPHAHPLRICSEGGADGAGERCRDAVGPDLAPLRPGHPPRRGHACGLSIYKAVSKNATALFVRELGERAT